MDLIDPPIALLAGVLTIASPCVLPLLPVVLGTSVERSGRLRPLFIVAGFVLAFASLGILLGLLSHSSGHVQEAVRSASTVLLALFGLTRIWPRPYDWLMARLGGLLATRGRVGGRRQRQCRRLPAGRVAGGGVDALRRAGAGIDPGAGRPRPGYRPRQFPVAALCRGRGHPDAGDRLRRHVGRGARGPHCPPHRRAAARLWCPAHPDRRRHPFQYDVLAYAWITGLFQ